MNFNTEVIKRLNDLGQKINFSAPETLYLPDDVFAELSRCQDASGVLRILFYWGHLLKISDITFSAGMPVVVKRANTVYRISKAFLNETTAKKLVLNALMVAPGDESPLIKLKEGGTYNTSYIFSFARNGVPGEKPIKIRYRINLMNSAGGFSMICRRNNDTIEELENIGQSSDGIVYKTAFAYTKGLNLVTGPVDSGKTTLLFALLAHFIKYHPRSAFIGTAENPIEADLELIAQEVMAGWRCPKNRPVYRNKVVSQTDISSMEKLDYVSIIPEFLRRNTDIMLLGEVRHPHEMEAVLTAVLSSGKLVYATMHTESAHMTLDRLIYSIPSRSEGEARGKLNDLIEALNMIVSQTLVKNRKHGRVAINETLVMTRELREHLKKTSIDRIADEVKAYMEDNQLSMRFMAKDLLDKEQISQEIYDEFILSYHR